jgi:hypothetical protein
VIVAAQHHDPHTYRSFVESHRLSRLDHLQPRRQRSACDHAQSVCADRLVAEGELASACSVHTNGDTV